MQITKEERDFIAAYRLADARAKQDAKQILERHRLREIPVSNIISISALRGISVDDLLSEIGGIQ